MDQKPFPLLNNRFKRGHPPPLAAKVVPKWVQNEPPNGSQNPTQKSPKAGGYTIEIPYNYKYFHGCRPLPKSSKADRKRVPKWTHLGRPRNRVSAYFFWYPHFRGHWERKGSEMRSKIGPESTSKRSRKRRTKTTKKGPKKHTSGTSFGRPKNRNSVYFLWYPHFRGVWVQERVQNGYPKNVQSPPKINPKTDQNGFPKNGNPTTKNDHFFKIRRPSNPERPVTIPSSTPPPPPPIGFGRLP